MLKAAIIFIQGSSGTLLARTLTLNKSTIPWVTVNNAHNQHLITPSPQARLEIYNNWNSDNWTATEKELSLWYKDGKNDFENYAMSDNLLIDSIHPLIFKLDSEIGLWTEDNFWEKLIFIGWNNAKSLDIIFDNAKLKRPDDSFYSKDALDESVQIIHELMKKYPNSYIVPWERIGKLSSYLEEINNISDLLGIELDMNLVTQLWSKWKTETDKLLYDTTE